MVQALTVDAVFDLETESWDRYVLGGLLTRDGYREFRDPDALADALLDIRGQAWAHNGGRYDALWFLDRMKRRCRTVPSISLAGSRVTRFTVGGLTVRDSAALIPMSLRDAAPIGGALKTSPGFPCRCGEDCGGYCSIRVDMPDADYRQLGEYLENDCRVTLAVLDAVFTFGALTNLSMRGTIGGTAWQSARAFASLPDAAWPSVGTYKLARRGYYGGRVQVFRPHANEGWRYDIHSSYPAALVRTPVPVGEPSLSTAERASLVYASGAEGVYGATIDVPADDWIPPLPVRTGERIWYPTGRLSGVWTGLELRHAESVGARVQSIDYALTWSASERVLKSWCERVWGWRDAAPNRAWSTWIKFLANSLTGKLAMRPDLRFVKIARQSEVPACDGVEHFCDGRHPSDRCCPHRCIGRCGAWENVGPSMQIWSKGAYRIPNCGHVHHAAYLTASARVELHSQLRHAGADAIYCDTDSVYSLRPLTRRIGAGLGDWGLEGAMRDWFAIAPKLYRYLDGENGWHVRAKGIPKAKWSDLDVLARGGMVTRVGGVLGFLSAARSGGPLFAARTVRRESHADGVHVGDRMLRGDITFPLDMVNIPRED